MRIKREWHRQNHRIGRQVRLQVRQSGCDNRGFSLAELIVAMAVMAIVGGGIAAVVIGSLRQYQTQGAEVNVQFEAQTAQNRIQDLVMDTRCGVSLAGSNLASTEKVVDSTRKTKTSVASVASGSTDSVELNIYDYDTAGNKIRIRITYNDAKHWLVYDRYTLDAGKNWVEDSMGECFATYIEGFKVTAVEETVTEKQPGSSAAVSTTRLKTLKIEVDYKAEARTFTSTNVINLRNPIILSSDVDKLYQ